MIAKTTALETMLTICLAFMTVCGHTSTACVWSYLHSYYWFYGYCNYYSSQGSSSDPNLCLVRDNLDIGDPDFCDDFSHNNKHDGSDDEEGNSSSSNTDEDATNDRDDEDSEEEEAADLSSAFQTASPLLIATVAASVLSFFFAATNGLL